MQQLVMTTYLEMNNIAELQATRRVTVPYQFVRVEIPCPELNRFLYATVGARWRWYSRLAWEEAHWLAYVNRPELETWVAYVSGTPAGYVELERQDGDEVEIVHFGLLPRFIGKGLGGALLTAAVMRAWNGGARRVWVHTCNFDHPQALRNYLARGFRVYRNEEKIEDLPDQPLQP
jgi:GNAT superfamily N-acetyltransferase